MIFEIRAADKTAKLVTIRLDAVDAADAHGQAVRMRLSPIAVGPAVPRGVARGSFDLMLFAEELQMLLSGGLTLVESIEGLAERQLQGATRSILVTLSSALRNGERLSGAMSRLPEAFTALFVGIVRAAERTSNLPAALARFVTYESGLRSFRERLVSAAIYPALLLLAGASVTLFLVVYVLPRFASVYQSSGRGLPWLSQVLLSMGQLLSEHTRLLTFLALAAVLLTWSAWRRSRTFSWLRLLTCLPGGRVHVATIEMSRLYRTLSMLLDGGMTLRDALALSRGVVSGTQAASVAELIRRIEDGQAFSQALHDAGLSTPLALRLLRVGERSGQLGAMLERAAQFHDHETGLWIERIGKIMSPVLMILISAIVGAVVISLYIPVFELAGSLR